MRTEKKGIQRLICLLLCFVMLLGMIPLAALAKEGTTNHAVERVNAQIAKLPANAENLTWEEIVSRGYYKAARIALRILTGQDYDYNYEISDPEDFAQIEGFGRLVYFCNIAAPLEAEYFAGLTAEDLKGLSWREAAELFLDISMEELGMFIEPEEKQFLYDYMDSVYGNWRDDAEPGLLDEWANVYDESPHSRKADQDEAIYETKLRELVLPLADTIMESISSCAPYDALNADEFLDVLYALNILGDGNRIVPAIQELFGYDRDSVVDEEGYNEFVKNARKHLAELADYLKQVVALYDAYEAMQNKYQGENEDGKSYNVFGWSAEDTYNIPDDVRAEAKQALTEWRDAVSDLPDNLSARIAYLLECDWDFWGFDNEYWGSDNQYFYLSYCFEEIFYYLSEVDEVIERLNMTEKHFALLPDVFEDMYGVIVTDNQGEEKEDKIVSYSNGTVLHQKITSVSPYGFAYYEYEQDYENDPVEGNPLDPDDPYYDQDYAELKELEDDVEYYVLNLAVAFGLTYKGNLKVTADGKNLKYTVGTPIPPKRSTDKTIIPIIFKKTDLPKTGNVLDEITVTYDAEINAAAWYGSITDKNMSYAYWECWDEGKNSLASNRYDILDAYYTDMNSFKVEDECTVTFCAVFGIKVYDYSNLDKKIEGFNGEFLGTDDSGYGFNPGDMYDPTTLAPLYLVDGAEYTITGTDYAGNKLNKVIVIRDNLKEYNMDSNGNPIMPAQTYAATAGASSSAGDYLVKAMGQDTLMKLLYYRYEHGIVPLETISVAQQSPYYALKTVNAYSQIVPANAQNPSAYANDGKVYMLEPEAFSADTNEAITVGDGGGLLLGGLGVGEYTLTMTKSPDDYAASKDKEIKIRLYWSDLDGNEVESMEDAETVFCEIVESGKKVPVYSSEQLDYLLESMPSYATLMNPLCMVLVYPIGHDRLSLTVEEQIVNGNNADEEKDFTFRIKLEEFNPDYYTGKDDADPYRPLKEVSYAIYGEDGEWISPGTVASVIDEDTDGYALINENGVVVTAVEPGVYEFKLNHGATVAFSNLMEGTKYTITEIVDRAEYFTKANDAAAGSTTNSGESVSFNDYGVALEGTLTYEKEIYHNVLFTNNPYGALTVTNEVTGNAADENKYFTYTVELSDTTINGFYGDMEFVNGVANFTLKHNESLTATGIPAGITYKVTESDFDDYYVFSKNTTGTITRDVTAVASFINDKDPRGNLTVSVEVSGNAADQEKEFTFTVELSDTTINETFGDMEFVDGVATFTLKHGESLTAKGIPADIGYTVTESDFDDYEVSSENAKGVIEKNTTAVASFINVKDPRGSLTISNNVTGNAADTDKEFTFTITLDDETINGVYGDVEFVNGVATFTLKNGESKTAAGLPEGIGYTVTVSDNEGYTVTVKNETGSIKKDMTVEVVFVNNKDEKTTEESTTEESTTEEPTTEEPTTEEPTTEEPTTEEPTTEEPTTEAPTTQAPTTQAPVTETTTQAPETTRPAGNNSPTSPATGSVRYVAMASVAILFAAAGLTVASKKRREDEE